MNKEFEHFCMYHKLSINYLLQSVTDKDMFKIQCIVFVNLWKLTLQHTLWSAVPLCKCRFYNVTSWYINLWKFQKCFWARDIVVCFKEVLRCYWNMQGNKSLESSWIKTNLEYIEPYHRTNDDVFVIQNKKIQVEQVK